MKLDSSGEYGKTILICNYFKDENTGYSELLVDYAINSDGFTVVVPCCHPKTLGGIFDYDLGEWVIL